MSKLTCLALSPEERATLQKALAQFMETDSRTRDMTRLARKLSRASFPKITVGVKGGMVQWISGNPFPVRVCDYDIDGCYPDYADEQGRPCVIEFAPADPTRRSGRYYAP